MTLQLCHHLLYDSIEPLRTDTCIHIQAKESFLTFIYFILLPTWAYTVPPIKSFICKLARGSVPVIEGMTLLLHMYSRVAVWKFAVLHTGHLYLEQS